MIGYQLVQDQRLKLNITPEMKQSIHILSLPGYELMQYLQEQATENPVLELESTMEVHASRRKIASGTSAVHDPFWNVQQAEETMEAKLKSQLRLLSLPAEVYHAAAYMAGNLNDDGYLEMTLTDIEARLNSSEAVILKALDQLQSLEPAGIGARNLRECLLLQIVRDPACDPFAYSIVHELLQEAASGNVGRIVSALKITREQVMTSLRYIQSLNPRPGSSMIAFEPQYIVPDAMIETHREGFTVSLHPSSRPRISISSEYREWAGLYHSDVASSYMNECLKSAQGIIRSVELRKRTLLRVIGAIMEEQRDFLMKGVQGLKPMTLSTISRQLEMHESTVSRAVHHKFLSTPHGVFPLRYFFAAGLPTSDGNPASSRKVKVRIKELIDSEDKSCPYSDQKIVLLLLAEGIRLSRRTVTKYREELKMGSSSTRKRKL
ncbi:RNA polymerase factor sigma-54 [Paenibacillus chibensis]|uniref:RNA polymerase factor sigma-54 n=1 Tax=Paenibacillus chibensis TaxID=59846 RepID=UPI001FE413C4|nr:RNA polymerase factor sigma-54 [Paenibacillus chibensis]MEC0371577.1 RNA polymerase factor sigma-54 [Paenibacillus chibensis]